jgi:hypothetical protein
MSFEEICTWINKEYEGYAGFGTDLVDRSRTALGEADAGGDPSARVAARQALSELLLRHGENEEAIALLDEALAAALAAALPESETNPLRLALGIAHLRQGETSHCIAMHNPDSCLFPLSAGGVWSDPAGAVRAIDHFEEYLAGAPDDHGARWILNVAHMAAGTWPDEVPEAWLVPVEVVGTATSPSGVARFRDVAGVLGVDSFTGAGGAIMDDFDGDGFLDLVSSSIFPCDPLRYYRNNGDGTFADRSEEAGILAQLGGLNCVHADYDGDGDVDVLVLRGAWMGRRYGRQRNSLLQNDGAGRFTDVTVAAGLGSDALPTQTADWADYDRDGDLDLYIGNEHFPNQLFQNQGDGTFVDIAATAGVGGGKAFTKGVAWGDYDNDGHADIYTSNFGMPNQLFHSLGDGTFADVAAELGIAHVPLSDDVPGDERDERRTSDRLAKMTFATWFWDMDNDGWLDIYVSGYSATLSNIAADYLGEPVVDPRRLRLYRNDGKGGFEDVAAKMGVADIRLPMGANYGDVDNDGFQDFYLGTGQPHYEYLLPNVLYMNRGGRAFEDATTAAGVGHLQKGHGVAFGDLDNDGDLDLFAQMGGFYPADGFHDAVFENPGNDNHWVTLVLRGAGANPFAVGARVRVTVKTPGGMRDVYALAGTGGSFGSSSQQLEIGLGDAERIEALEVRWPAGDPQVFRGVPLDRFVRLTEGEDEIEPLERPAVRFPGG